MVTYSAQYPPAHNSTYVKATTADTTDGYPYFATDPAKSGLGALDANAWLTSSGTYTNQKFNIDLGSAKVIKAITIENFHDDGFNSNIGINNFVLYGSNTASVLSDTTYASTANLVSLGTYAATQRAGPGTPSLAERFLVSNTTAYRYYVLRITDNHGSTSYMGFRKIEFETEDAANTASYTGDGGFILGGSAESSFVGGLSAIRVTMDGGFVLGGSASVVKSLQYESTGGVVLGGITEVMLKKFLTLNGSLGFAGEVNATQHNNTIVGALGFNSNIKVVQWNNSIKGSIGFSGDFNAYQEGSFSTKGVIGFLGSIEINQPNTLSLIGSIGFNGSVIAAQDKIISMSGKLGFSGEVNIVSQHLLSITGSIGFSSYITAAIDDASDYTLPSYNSTRWT